MSTACPHCGADSLEEADATGVTWLWPDDTPFDPQPTQWDCTACGVYHELRGLTPEQRARLQPMRQHVA